MTSLGGGGHLNSAAILIFPPGSNGDSPPIRTITGPNTGLTSPSAIALDSHENIYVTNNDERGTNGGVGTITVFAAGADGDVKPLYTINGPAPRHVPHMIPIVRLGAIAVDPTGNIYVEAASSDPAKRGKHSRLPPTRLRQRKTHRHHQRRRHRNFRRRGHRNRALSQRTASQMILLQICGAQLLCEVAAARHFDFFEAQP